MEKISLSLRGTFIYILLLFTLQSCFNTRKTGTIIIRPQQTWYYTSTTIDNNGAHYLTDTKTNPDKMLATIAPDDDHPYKTLITPLGTAQVVTTTTETANPTKVAPDNDFFPLDRSADKITTTHSGFTNTIIQQGRSFKYRESEPLIQAMAIPIKYRPKIKAASSSMASSDFTVAGSYGWKDSYKKITNTYTTNPKNNTVNEATATTTFAFTRGIFIGPTAVDLTTATTDNMIPDDRTVIGVTLGGFFVVQINSFNVGAAVGMDYTGVNQHWIYSGKPWIGLMVGIELFK